MYSVSGIIFFLFLYRLDQAALSLSLSLCARPLRSSDRRSEKRPKVGVHYIVGSVCSARIIHARRLANSRTTASRRERG